MLPKQKSGHYSEMCLCVLAYRNNKQQPELFVQIENGAKKNTTDVERIEWKSPGGRGIVIEPLFAVCPCHVISERQCEAEAQSKLTLAQTARTLPVAHSLLLYFL